VLRTQSNFRLHAGAQSRIDGILNLGVQMGASDLPLDIQQRIEQRWSAQIKRHQQEREHEARANSPASSDAQDARGLIHIADWGRRRADDR
jgi:hypothetical protein